LNVIFFGSSGMSVPFLEGLYKSGHRITLVITKTDKQAGRGRKLTPNIVKSSSVELGINFIQINKFNDTFYEDFKKFKFDVAVVVSFGEIIPEKILNIKKAEWLNIHPSLLPKYRGPTPIISALLNRDSSGGESIIKVTPEVDKGEIYAQVKFGINEDENRDGYQMKVVKFGIPALLTVLDMLKAGNASTYPQGEENTTYTHKIKSEDLRINWEYSAVKINDRIRAFSPEPGAYFFWKGLRIKILKARVPDESERNQFFSGLKADKESVKNGLVVMADKKSGIAVRCNEREIIKIELLKPQGRKTMAARDFINGYRISAGENFE